MRSLSIKRPAATVTHDRRDHRRSDRPQSSYTHAVHPFPRSGRRRSTLVDMANADEGVAGPPDRHGPMAAFSV